MVVVVVVAVVSQRVIRVTLRKTFRNYENESRGVPPLQSYLLLKFLCAIARGFSINCIEEIQIEIRSERKTVVNGLYK